MEPIISTDKKIFSIKELKALGFSQYNIRNMVKSGELERLNRFNYENKNFEGEETEYIYVYAYVPDGIICLLSAAAFYGLTTYRPDCIDVAVKRKRNLRTFPDWPTIKLWYFEDLRLETGVSEIESCNKKVNIFDIEKTVIDIVYYRNKIGIEETKEILVNYLARPESDINKLCRYASKLRCKEVLDTYLEVLV